MQWALRKEGQKVVIGDNLVTHFDTDILKLYEDFCLVPNSTQISQLLNVTFYGPLKEKWRKISKEWKLKNHIQTAMPKDSFPALLKQLVHVLDRNNLKSSSEAVEFIHSTQMHIFKVA